MRIIKPLRIGCMTKIAALGSKCHHITVTGQLCWDLAEPNTLHTDSAMWESISAEFGGRCYLDAWESKQRGEFLAWGQAIAPQGQPVERMQVGVCVGTQSKHIAVVGNRYWRPTLLRTEHSPIEPFTHMPLEYKFAYGGPNYPANPLGLGHGAPERMDADLANVQLPNLEDPKKPILHQGDEPVPCIFAPVDLTWPAQLSRRGTFNDSWLKQRYPRMPIDLDRAMYNVAPLDQQLNSGYFKGDELVRIEGMNAQYPIIQSCLPSLKIRIFAMRKGQGQALQEFATTLDTVWLFPGALKGVLLYRALVPCTDPDMLDIEALMFACDRAAYPRTLSHYQEVYQLRSDEETKNQYLLADDQLMPELLPEVLRRLEQKRQEVRQEREEKWRLKGEHFSAMAVAAGGIAMPAPSTATVDQQNALLSQIPIVLPEDIARGNVDFASIERAAKHLRQNADDMRAAALQLLPPKIHSTLSNQDKPSEPFTPKKIVQILGLQEAQAQSLSTSHELLDLATRLEADPHLSPHQELSNWVKAKSSQSQSDFRALVHDKKLLSFLDEGQALQEAMAAQSPRAQNSGDPVGLRQDMITSIRTMASTVAQGVFALPDIDPQAAQAATLKALGIHADPAEVPYWPAGKMGMLMQRAIAQALEKDGLLGLVQLSGQLQLASLPAMPPEQRAAMQQKIEQQIQRESAHAVSYKVLCPEAEKEMVAAFTDPQRALHEKKANTRDERDHLQLMKDVVANIENPQLRSQLQAFVERAENQLTAALSQTSPEWLKDGKINFQQVQQSTSALSALLTGFQLPANDDLPENDELTYDKRFVRALAQGWVGRAMGLPLKAWSHGDSASNERDQKNLALAGSTGSKAFEDLQQAENMLIDARKRLPSIMPGLNKYPAEVASYLGQWIMQAHRQGLSLAGRDLAGADLHGVDLTGADLRGTLLEGANLMDAKLDGVQAQDILLTGAQLQRSSWRGAQLQRANLGQAQAQEAVFVGADLSDAKFFEINMANANCAQARLDRIEGLNSNLHGVQAQGSSCNHTKFLNADLSDINLERAQWSHVIILQGSMARLQARQAQFDQCTWAKLDLSGSNLQETQVQGLNLSDCNCDDWQADGMQAVLAVWTRGSLHRAQFKQASLERALFEDVRLDQASFHTSNLPGAFFMRCTLNAACFNQAQLMGASFHNAKLGDANLRYANLHNADFSQAQLDRADLTGSRRLGSLLEMPRQWPQA